MSEKELNSEIAICTDAQWTACGASGLNGICAPRRAAEACKEELVQFWYPKETEESDVLVIQCKWKLVICNPVKFARIAPGMPNSVQHGKSFAPTVHLSRDVAENLVICADRIPWIPWTF